MAGEKAKKEAAAPKEAPRRASKLKQALELKRQYEALIRDAHDDAVRQIQQLIDELNQSGYDYRLVTPQQLAEIESSARQGNGGKAKGGAKQAAAPDKAKAGDPSAHYDKAKYCKKCNEHGHDTKAHNSADGFKDKPFSLDEMAKRGFLPPELAEAYRAEQSHTDAASK